MIPKTIHYCWLSGDPIPQDLLRCMESWQRVLPDYEFKLWNFNVFPKNSSLWVKQAFDAKKYAFAADYIRLYAVYNYGGIYMDMDVEVVKSFNDLLSRDYILGYEKAEGIEAGIFGASPKAEWLKKCLDYYDGRSFINGDGSMNMTPLPKIMYNILKDNGYLDGILAPLQPEYFTAKSYETGKIFKTKNTYTIHHFAGSWTNGKQKLYKMVSRVAGDKFARVCSIIYNNIRTLPKKIS